MTNAAELPIENTAETPLRGPPRRRQEIESELVAGLPEAFAHRADDGTMQQIKEPCYNLLAPVYVGDTFWNEGEIIITPTCPNFQMQPLNKAAAINMENWIGSLPTANVSITIEDTVEAAMLLRNHPEVSKMDHDQAAAAVQKLALGLKRKREEKNGLALPGLDMHGMRPANSKAAPMPNMRYTDPTLRGPGQTGNSAVIHQPKRGDNSTRRASAMGSMPPQAR